jgi:hypothetical protein
MVDTIGLVGGIAMMGYANPGQHANGIHMRLYSRGENYGCIFK